MRRVRYEVFCDGRLLKETEQVQISGFPSAVADSGNPRDFLDGQYRWMVDQQYVSDDVAQAMLAARKPWGSVILGRSVAVADQPLTPQQETTTQRARHHI